MLQEQAKKTAERIILELKDRIEPSHIAEEANIIENVNEVHIAIHGLISLGYTRGGEIMKALDSMDTDGLDTEAIIREALKRLSKQ